jgi:hypothetical protein
MIWMMSGAILAINQVEVNMLKDMRGCNSIDNVH